ncbi:MAG: hypothetical protein FWE31_01055 [Firmicutes bacterium]|nr:hypothetical protein [Bacillota bacterium]
MKKFLLILVVFPVAFLLTGCIEDRTVAYADGLIVQAIRISNASFGDATNAEIREVIADAELGLGEFHINRSGNMLQIILEFGSRENFLAFNGVTISPPVRDAEVEFVVTSFFVERTLTIPNPFYPVDTTAKNGTARDLSDLLVSEFGGTGVQLFEYVFGSSIRRTSSNAEHIERYGDGWFHFFTPEHLAEYDGYIIIFDRLANTPAWYGVGVAATLVFMLAVWLMFKGRNQPQVQNQ